MVRRFSLLLASMGDVALTLSQVYGIEHSRLDNTPLNLTELSDEQVDHMRRVNDMVKLRGQLSPFFAWPHLDQGSDIAYVSTSDQSHNYGYLWIKRPAYETPEIPDGQEVVVLINNSQYKLSIELPPGEWFLQSESSQPKAARGESLQGAVNTHAFSTSLFTRLPILD